MGSGLGTALGGRKRASVERESGGDSIVDCIVERLKKVMIEGRVLEQLQESGKDFTMLENHLLQSIRSFTSQGQEARGLASGTKNVDASHWASHVFGEEGTSGLLDNAVEALGVPMGPGEAQLGGLRAVAGEKGASLVDAGTHGLVRDSGWTDGSGRKNSGPSESIRAGGPSWAGLTGPPIAPAFGLRLPSGLEVGLGADVSHGLGQEEKLGAVLMGGDEEDPEEDPQPPSPVMPDSATTDFLFNSSEIMTEAQNHVTLTGVGYKPKRSPGVRIIYTARKSIPRHRELRQGLTSTITGKREGVVLGDGGSNDLSPSSQRKKRAIHGESDIYTNLAEVANQPHSE